MDFATITAELLSGFGTSLILFTGTLLLSLPLGLLFCFGSMSKIVPVKWFFKFIIWVLRGTPLMLQIVAVFYVPGLLTNGAFRWPDLNTGWQWFDANMDKRFWAVLFAFTINYAAYFSEIYRGGIQSVPRGQYEAGYVLGMNKTQVFFKVIWLQVVKRIVPPMSNEIITLVKDTSLAKVIGVTELMFAADAARAKGLIWPIFYAGAFYLVFVGVLTIVLGRLEKKLSYFKV